MRPQVGLRASCDRRNVPKGQSFWLICSLDLDLAGVALLVGTRFRFGLPALFALVVKRDVDGEAGAFALAALDLHPAIVPVDDLLYDGQADAEAAALAVAA